MSAVRAAAATMAALAAFASNSLLCRAALGTVSIDAGTFTIVRLASGAAVLRLLSVWRRPAAAGRHAGDGPAWPASPGQWGPALALTAYAVAFSFAYTSLDTGTGALILFGAVQVWVTVVALGRGERALLLEWLGIAAAASGLVYLVLPGLTAPPLGGSLLMAGAGAAWGAYTLYGRRAADPVRDNTISFGQSVPLACAAVIAALLLGHGLDASLSGLALAVASGITSGLGYVVWYTAVPRIGGITAATVQLAVPVVAATGGIVVLGERPTMRLAVSAGLILGGIGVGALARARR